MLVSRCFTHSLPTPWSLLPYSALHWHSIYVYFIYTDILCRELKRVKSIFDQALTFFSFLSTGGGGRWQSFGCFGKFIINLIIYSTMIVIINITIDLKHFNQQIEFRACVSICCWLRLFRPLKIQFKKAYLNFYVWFNDYY